MEKTGDSAALVSTRRRQPRAAWVKLVRSLADSGLSPEEFAAKKGIELNRLKFWMRILRNDVEARTRSTVPAFLPVSVLPTAKARAADAGVMVEVDLANGRRLRMQVKANTDFHRVSELVDALESGLRC
jgi:hypothetical protein